jgi:hypothetical protein
VQPEEGQYVQEPDVTIEKLEGAEAPKLKPFKMPIPAFPVLITAGPVRIYIHADGSIQGSAQELETALRQAPSDQLNPMMWALLGLTLNAMKLQRDAG